MVVSQNTAATTDVKLYVSSRPEVAVDSCLGTRHEFHAAGFGMVSNAQPPAGLRLQSDRTPGKQPSMRIVSEYCFE